MDDFKPHLSIIIPLYNAAATLPALHQDETEAVALKLTRESQLLCFLSLSRNFGEHNTVFAGIQLLLLGIMGEYIGRIYLGISEKPQSVVREEVRSGSISS